MAKLRVTIIDEVRNRRLKVDLPDDAAVDKLLPALAKKLGLPPAAYQLTHGATGRVLGGDQTLASFGVGEGDALRLAAAREEVSTMPRKLPVWAWFGIGGVVLLAVAVLALRFIWPKPVPTPTVVVEVTTLAATPAAMPQPTDTPVPPTFTPPPPTATPVPLTDTPRPTATKKPALSPTAVPTLVSTQAPTFPFTLKLPANAGWVETDVALQAGQSVIVTAEGVADFAGGDPAVGGTTPNGFASEGVNCDKGYAEKVAGQKFTIDCLLSGAPWGALVGRIGNGTPFLIGASHQFIASESGKLYLACNDCCNLSDNMGAYSVTVSLPSVTPMPPTPTPSASRKIAFNSKRDGNSEIYVMNADGSQQTNLTHNPADDIWPAWSPDGSKIAFTSKRDGNREIYVMNADGSNPTRLTNNPAVDYWPDWSPDGSRIVFHSERDGNREIYVMNADGSNQTRLTDNPAVDGWPRWSPDGSKIAFTRMLVNEDGSFNLPTSEIWVMSADGGGQMQLTSNDAYDLGACWSPDGRYILFTSKRDGNYEIYRMKADGSYQVNLTQNPADEAEPAWWPGDRIAFVVYESGYESEDLKGAIYVMNTDGGSRVRLTDTLAENGNPCWSP